MTKNTKKELIENALVKISEKRITEAKWFSWCAIFKNWLKIAASDNNFTWNQKDRREVIRKSIRSGLKNTTPRDDNKAFYHDTSSNNIITISVRLKKH